MALGVCAVVGAMSADAVARVRADDRPLQAMVTPRLARAPAVVRILVIVQPAEENRGLMLVLDSGEYFRSSVVPIDGDRAPRVHQAEFRAVPAGDHQVRVVLLDRRGQERATVQDAVHVTN